MVERDVVVVGAGPVGLAAALAVRATGRPVTVVEAGAADRVRPGSRAIFLHNVTLQVLDRIRAGLGSDLARQGLAWTTRRTLYRGREVYHRTYPAAPPGALPAATSLPQAVTERVLLDAALDAGVEFLWSTPASGARADRQAVLVDTEGGSPISARYVIGADGARSAIRESAGLRLEGPRTSNAFVIVDIAEDPGDPWPLERVFHYEHPGVGFRNVLFVPFAGHWRVDLQCREGDDPDAFSSAAGVWEWLARVMPAKVMPAKVMQAKVTQAKVMQAKYADRVTWVSTYVFRQAIANQFTDASSRILLAGEAGHVFAPFGARGLNSGIADALVAARAVDAALRAGAVSDAERAIQAGARSRRAAAARNRAASSAALAHLQAHSPVRRAIRRVAGRLAPSVSAIGRWMDQAPFGPPLGGADRDGMYY